MLVTLGTISFASLGLIVASVTNTMQETQIINQIIWFVFLFISGATIPFPMLAGRRFKRSPSFCRRLIWSAACNAP